MKLGPFIFCKTCWSFNEGGRFLTLSLLRFKNYRGVRLWVQGHAINVGVCDGKLEFKHHYHRVASKREVKARREGIGGV